MSVARSAVLGAALLLGTTPVTLAEDGFLTRMAAEHVGDHPVPTLAAETAPRTGVVSREADYADLDGTSVRGYLATPKAAAAKAGLLLIHEWWGLNDNVRAVAERYAGEGYAALAVDLYEGRVATNRDEAIALVQGTQEHADRTIENLRQAATFLRRESGVERVGVIGWCFGGGWSLQTALALGDGIDAVVVYYGRLVTEPDELAKLQAPLLGHFGALDTGIPVEQVRDFEKALAALGKEATTYVYEGAGHAFANSSGTGYNEEAATLAWDRTLEFLDHHLGSAAATAGMTTVMGQALLPIARHVLG